MNYPISVFLDTNIFISCKYDLSDEGILKILEKLVKKNKVNVYISNIVLEEVQKHIKEDISKALNKFRSARMDAMNKISPSVFDGTKLAKYFVLPLKEEVKSSAFDNFLNFIQSSKMIILDNQGVNIDSVLEDYFNNKPPFENKENKKYEFPDAFVAAKLKEQFSEENPVWIISGDKGFQNAFNCLNGFHCMNSLKELFDLINQQDKEIIYDSISEYLNGKEAVEEISQKIKEKITNDQIEINGLDCDRKGFCEGYDYIDTFVTDISDVVYHLNSIDYISDDSVTTTIMSNVEIFALCTYEDYENSLWDSEEEEYVFLQDITYEERHQVDFECTLKFFVHSEEDKIMFELSEITYDFVLDQDTRVERSLFNQEDPRISADAEMWDTLEDYHKQNSKNKVISFEI